MRVRVTGNDVECTVGARKDASGMALLVGGGVQHTDGSALITDNRMSGRPPSAVAAVILVPVVGTNANVVSNANLDAKSVALVGCRTVAVTGNIVRGRALLPPRPFAPPLDTWAPLNTGM
jgi:hypothetical protein